MPKCVLHLIPGTEKALLIFLKAIPSVGYFLTTSFNVKVSAGEGKAFIGIVDTYIENKPVHSLITKM